MIRLIARIDSRNGHHIKTVNCEGVQKIRTIEESLRIYSDQNGEYDEIIMVDSVASLYGTKNWLLASEQSHYYCPIPLSIGGGIQTIGDAIATLKKGADKLILNTGAIKNPEMLKAVSEECGKQAVVLQIDAKYIKGKYFCFTEGARELTRMTADEWIDRASDNGVGEIHLTSIDSEGTDKSFPEKLCKIAVDNTDLPVILSGGFRNASQIAYFASKYNISAFSMSSVSNICKISINDYY